MTFRAVTAVNVNPISRLKAYTRMHRSFARAVTEMTDVAQTQFRDIQRDGPVGVAAGTMLRIAAMRHAPPSRSTMIVVHIRRTLPSVVIS
jgi:hypothetical protein